MPRDINGNYTLPAGNPVVTDTTIESSWANDTMQDLAAEITDSLSRSGKGALTSPFRVIDFEGLVPGLAYANEPTSGYKRFASGDLRPQVLGVDAMRFTTTTQYARSGGSLKAIVVEESGQKVMRGQDNVTKCYFYNSTVPTGWTLANPDANVRTLLVGGTGGSIAGSSNPSSYSASVTTTVTVNLPANTGAHTLTEAEMPSHNHTQKGAADTSSSILKTPLVNTTATNQVAGTSTEPAGGGASHTHPLGGTAAGTGSGNTSTITPRYAMGVIGTL